MIFGKEWSEKYTDLLDKNMSYKKNMGDLILTFFDQI